MVLSAQQKAALMKAVHLAILGWTLEAVLQKDWGARDLDAAEVFTTAQAVVAAARLGGYRAEAYDINLPGGRGIQEEAGLIPASSPASDASPAWWPCHLGPVLQIVWVCASPMDWSNLASDRR